MEAQRMTLFRPAALSPSLGAGSRVPAQATREARLATLQANWERFAPEYEQMRQANNQEVMTNLRALLLLIKKEIVRLGGQAPEFPYPEGPHLADL